MISKTHEGLNSSYNIELTKSKKFEAFEYVTPNDDISKTIESFKGYGYKEGIAFWYISKTIQNQYRKNISDGNPKKKIFLSKPQIKENLKNSFSVDVSYRTIQNAIRKFQETFKVKLVRNDNKISKKALEKYEKNYKHVYFYFKVDEMFSLNDLHDYFINDLKQNKKYLSDKENETKNKYKCIKRIKNLIDGLWKVIGEKTVAFYNKIGYIKKQKYYNKYSKSSYVKLGASEYKDSQSWFKRTKESEELEPIFEFNLD